MQGFMFAKHVVPYVAAVVIGGAGVGYAIHEHHSAQDLAAQNAQVTAQLNASHSQLDATHSQLDALTAKVNALAQSSETRPSPAAGVAGVRGNGTRHGNAQDARYKKLQSQVDAQGKAIDAARSDLDSTRSDLAGTRTELTGSIARTHDELVVLQKKGERNYYEFDLQKSKDFKREGPLNISLRKANTKHQYADLQVILQDRNLTEKHVNLYQPATFYQPESQQPVEMVINDISKDHIHGYISAPKYRPSELTTTSTTSTVAANPAASPDQAGNATAQPPSRHKLPPPSNPDQP